jgi:carbon-monoxide dehydrogenase small subunit
MSRSLDLTVNGGRYSVAVPPGAYLLDVLRDELGLQGTKEACAEGECGSCTVLVDGEPVDSCIYFAHQAGGRSVTTVEGIGEAGGHPVQRAFAEHGAVQCGFCTPGFVVAAAALLERAPHPDEAEIRNALAGNLCRCTGYEAIVAAVLAAAEDST